MPRTKNTRTIKTERPSYYFSTGSSEEENEPVVKNETKKRKGTNANPQANKLSTQQTKTSTSHLPFVANNSPGSENEIEQEDMQTALTSLKKDMDKSVLAKRKKMSQYTEVAIEKHNAKVQKSAEKKWDTSCKLMEDFTNNIEKSFGQWEASMKAFKEEQIRIMARLEKQNKMMQCLIAAKSECLQFLHSAHKDLVKNQQALENKHKSEIAVLHGELCTELEKVLLKMNSEKTKMAFANVRKSLLYDL